MCVLKTLYVAHDVRQYFLRETPNSFHYEDVMYSVYNNDDFWWKRQYQRLLLSILKSH